MNLHLRILPLLGLVIAWADAGRADIPPLLRRAVDKIVASDQHWAYTRTTQPLDADRKPKGGPTVEEFDPSQPDGSRWTLVEFKGHAPSPDDLAEWQKQKKLVASERKDRNLGELLDLEHATVMSQTELWANFDVPILPNASARFPADKLQVIMHVDKMHDALVAFRVQQREKFRIAGVASVDDLEVSGHMIFVDDKYAPVLASVRWDGNGRILGFYKLGFGNEQTYTHYHRVVPYSEKMGIKSGQPGSLNLGT
jgi:hypothetical protein